MKIKLSKSQWHKIGKLAGWIKTAYEGEIIEIDGEKYKEANGDLVEITEDIPKSITSNQPNQPKSIKFNIKGEEVVLTEGKTYRNYFGSYILNSINDTEPKTITVIYLDGQNKDSIQTYPAKSQAEAIKSEEKRAIRQEETATGIEITKFSTNAEFYTLGYLAKHSRILVEVPKNLTEKFERQYNALTGDTATSHIQDNSYYIAPKEENRWYIKGRLTFPVIEEAVNKLSFPSDVNIIHKGDNVEINNNNYIFNLFRNGFKLGENSGNYGIISRGLSGEAKQAFDQGFNS